MNPLSVAVVMPVLNESGRVRRQLVRLHKFPELDEVLIVDGGSRDKTREIAEMYAMETASGSHGPVMRVMTAPRGRALQMNAGAADAGSDILLFLHVDTVLPDTAPARIRAAVSGGRLWGYFEVRLSGRHALFRVIERLMNLRTRLTGIVTGDQALFVRRDVFRMLGGFAPIALMEDVEFSRRLKWLGRPARIREQVETSTRRWERRGIYRTVFLMWTLRLLYWLGVSPKRLARWYH